MSLAAEYLRKLRLSINEIEVSKAHQLQGAGDLLIDIREPDETAAGLPAGAVALPRSALELKIEQLAQPGDQVMLLCGSGQRSLLAAANLHELGYTRICSVIGGYAAWKNAQLPVVVPPRMDSVQRQRYSRQMILDQVGEAGQARLEQSRVLVVGAGGLGCPASLYLAAAGVGTLTLADADRVELSNLHRQVLHGTASLGEPKVQSARARLRALNPEISVRALESRVTEANVEGLVAEHELIIDGADNLATRYLLNAACVAAGKPLVYAAVERFDAQVSVFWPAAPDGPWPCYRCLFPYPPPPEAAPNCAEAGVLGVVPGIVGMMQANEALKLLLQIGKPLTGRLLCFDARQASWRELRLPVDPHCPGCGDQPAAVGDIVSCRTAD